ncbi:TM2 domain protein [Ancylostoma ceylanicum]|uniref:TM2 domain protein n=1 Tax=Ancylostoma ceylanicum TaxID=53326 RepID=A0A0D6LG07_9BILA|nr:TM2 domain protein [Ancylostoma ceylanicum]
MHKQTALFPCIIIAKYACEPPAISVDTQQPLNCNEDNSVTVTCKVASGIICRGLLNGTRFFYLEVPNACSYHAHLHHSTALLLSIFFGFLGIDRMYLGYYAVGIVKMFSLGGLFVLWLIDVVLIALQLLQPADGSRYIMNYYGPRVSPLRSENKMATEQQLQMVAELEMEMMSDMYRRMTTACQEKCISNTFKEGELTKGEAVCLDRCVAKYLDVHEKLGKRLTTMSQNDEAALQKPYRIL